MLKHAYEHNSLTNFQNHKFLKPLWSLELKMDQSTLKIPKDHFILLFYFLIIKSIPITEKSENTQTWGASYMSHTWKEPWIPNIVFIIFSVKISPPMSKYIHTIFFFTKIKGEKIVWFYLFLMSQKWSISQLRKRQSSNKIMGVEGVENSSGGGSGRGKVQEGSWGVKH